MWWLFTFAFLVVVLVGGAVLPRRAQHAREGFPWFWIAFPLTAFITAAAVNAWISWLGVPLEWSMYKPLADSDGTVQFLGNEQFWQARAIFIGRWVLPLAAAAAAGLSVWAWRRDRV